MMEIDSVLVIQMCEANPGFIILIIRENWIEGKEVGTYSTYVLTLHSSETKNTTQVNSHAKCMASMLFCEGGGKERKGRELWDF